MSKLLQKCILFCCILCLPQLCLSKINPNFQIKGLTGDVLINVEQRLMELQLSKTLNSLSSDELKTLIEKAMYPFGYFKPLIQIQDLSSDKLSITIQTGPLLSISTLILQIRGDGKNNPALEKIVKSFPLKKGSPLISSQYEAAKQMLLTTAMQEGYRKASFDTAEMLIDLKQYTASITVILNTGAQYYFGQVQFDPTYISPKLLERYLPFQYGKPYSEKELRAFNEALQTSGYFKSLSIKPRDSNDTYVPIDVHVEPASPKNYSLSLGYGTDTGPRGQAGLHIVPLNPEGHKFNALALGSFKENTLKTQYIIPGNNPLRDQYEIGGSFSRLDYDSGKSSSTLLTLAQRHILPDFERVLTINNLYERFQYKDIAATKEHNFSFFPEATFTWLHKSDPLFSPNGYALSMDSFLANKHLLSNINFAQTTLDAKGAWTLEEIRTRFYLHGSLGLTQTANINKMPLSLALLLGGTDNMKGFAYNSIGPGKLLHYGGLEIQKELKAKWYLTGFFDTGAVYNPDPYHLLKDAGIGLMWVSPIGPIKVGVAVPLDDHFHPNFTHHPQLIIKMGPDL